MDVLLELCLSYLNFFSSVCLFTPEKVVWPTVLSLFRDDVRNASPLSAIETFSYVTAHA